MYNVKECFKNCVLVKTHNGTFLCVISFILYKFLKIKPTIDFFSGGGGGALQRLWVPNLIMFTIVSVIALYREVS